MFLFARFIRWLFGFSLLCFYLKKNISPQEKVCRVQFFPAQNGTQMYVLARAEYENTVQNIYSTLTMRRFVC